MLEQVRDRIATHNKKKNGRLTLSVEYGHGETYSNRDITVYALDDYDRSSVLHGRERRMWLGDFGDGPQCSLIILRLPFVFQGRPPAPFPLMWQVRPPS
jgi:hypothetical protein